MATPHAPAEEIGRRVSVRMRRQQLLTQAGATELWAVLDEAALRRPPDGPKVMRAQLEHLLQITEVPRGRHQDPQLQAPVHSQADYARAYPQVAAQPGEATRDRQFVRPWREPA